MKIKTFLSLIIIFFPLSFLSAEYFGNADNTFTLDFPEGFAIAQQNGDDSYHFKHTQLPVDVILRIYPLSRYNSSESAIDNVCEQLQAEISHQSYTWRNTNCCLGTFNFSNGAKEGWALSVELPLEKGILVLLVYTDKAQGKALTQFQISILDSLCIDRGSFYEAGPVTSYAFPPEGKKECKIHIEGMEIETSIDIVDEEANKFVIEREYAILNMYVQSKMLNEAWKRYYRIIYKDSYHRMRKAAFDIYNEIFPIAVERNKENPDYELAQILLSWVQKMKYKRDFSSSDFSPLPKVLCEGDSDCDSRSLLLAVLMSQMNYKTMLFVSPEYQHAFFGIDIEGKGAHLKVGNTSYLLGETTANVALGLVPQDMSDMNKWMGMLNE